MRSPIDPTVTCHNSSLRAENSDVEGGRLG